MTDTTTAARLGSAATQGDLWNPRARDYAELQEGLFRPLYESVLQRPEIAGGAALLDVGCGPGLAAQVFSQEIANVGGIDASAAFITIALQRLPGRDFRVGEMEALPCADASFDVVTASTRFNTPPRRATRSPRRSACCGPTASSRSPPGVRRAISCAILTLAIAWIKRASGGSRWRRLPDCNWGCIFRAALQGQSNFESRTHRFHSRSVRRWTRNCGHEGRQPLPLIAQHCGHVDGEKRRCRGNDRPIS
jgi:SAM-dependent methyltransferase